MITLDMIDDDLVTVIANSSSHIPGSWAQTYAIVRHVLAWLANNPIEPTEEQRGRMERDWAKDPSAIMPIPFAAREFQRIAYLKEEPLPVELKNLLFSLGTVKEPVSQVMDLMEEVVRGAWKVGRRECK